MSQAGPPNQNTPNGMTRESLTRSRLTPTLPILLCPTYAAGGYGAGDHPIPSRTRKLSPAARMVLPGPPGGRVRRRRPISTNNARLDLPRSGRALLLPLHQHQQPLPIDSRSTWILAHRGDAALRRLAVETAATTTRSPPARTTGICAIAVAGRATGFGELPRCVRDARPEGGDGGSLPARRG